MSLHKDLIDFIAEKGLKECDYRVLGVLLNEFAYTECYRMLCEIYEVVRDSNIPDAACYYKIDRILETFQARGIDTGDRHLQEVNEYGGIPISSVFKIDELL